MYICSCNFCLENKINSTKFTPMLQSCLSVQTYLVQQTVFIDVFISLLSPTIWNTSSGFKSKCFFFYVTYCLWLMSFTIWSVSPMCPKHSKQFQIKTFFSYVCSIWILQYEVFLCCTRSTAIGLKSKCFFFYVIVVDVHVVEALSSAV